MEHLDPIKLYLHGLRLELVSQELSVALLLILLRLRVILNILEDIEHTVLLESLEELVLCLVVDDLVNCLGLGRGKLVACLLLQHFWLLYRTRRLNQRNGLLALDFLSEAVHCFLPSLATKGEVLVVFLA